MKSRLGTCIKFFLKSSYREMFNMNMNPALTFMIYIGCCIALSVPLCFLVEFMYGSYEALNQLGSLVAMLLFVGSTATLLMGIYTVFSNFFFSNDVDYLLPLPFKSGEIMIGKFTSTLIMLYVYVSIIILPLLMIGFKAGYGVLYYITLIPVIILLPVLPLAYCIIISLIIMRVTNVGKHKDLFKTIAGIIGLAAIVGFNMLSSKSDYSEVEMVNMISKENGLMDIANGIFVSNKFGAEALVNAGNSNGFINFGIFILISIAIIIVLYFAGQLLYRKAVIGGSEINSKKEDIMKTGKVNLKVKSPIITLAVRDIKLILRTPTFFLNCVVMLIYFPAILLAVGVQDNLINLGDMSNMPPEFVEIFIPMIAVLPGVLFMTGAGMAASTALSREGKNILVSKYIPVPYKDQYKSKIVSSLCINMIAVIGCMGFLIYLDMPIITIVLGGILAFAAVLVVTLTGLFIDYTSPKLNWADEKDIANKDFKPLIVFIILLIIGFLIAYGGYELGTIVGNNFGTIDSPDMLSAGVFIFVFNIITLGLISVILYKITVKKVEFTYRKHEI